MDTTRKIVANVTLTTDLIDALDRRRAVGPEPRSRSALIREAVREYLGADRARGAPSTREQSAIPSEVPPPA